jgi:hypothetical protein
MRCRRKYSLGDSLGAIAYLQYDGEIFGSFLPNGRLPADRKEVIKEFKEAALSILASNFRCFIDKGPHFFFNRLVIEAAFAPCMQSNLH